MKCPRCYKEIEAQDIDIATNVGFCSSCKLIYRPEKKKSICWLKHKMLKVLGQS